MEWCHPPPPPPPLVAQLMLTTLCIFWGKLGCLEKKNY